MTARAFARGRLWQLVGGVSVIALLALHTLGWATVDGASLGLLGLFLLLPHLPRLTKLKWGNMEAELSERESMLRVDSAYDHVHFAAASKGLPLTPSEDVSKVLEGYTAPGASIASCRRALEQSLESYASLVGVNIDAHASPAANSRSLFLHDKLDLPVKRSIELLEPVLDACGASGGQASWPLAQRIRETVDTLAALLEIEGLAQSGRFEEPEGTSS